MMQSISYLNATIIQVSHRRPPEIIVESTMKYRELVDEVLQFCMRYRPPIPPIEVCQDCGISVAPSGGAPPEYVVAQISVRPPCSELSQHEKKDFLWMEAKCIVPMPRMHTEVAINRFFVETEFVVDFMQLGTSKGCIFVTFLKRPTINPYILPRNASQGKSIPYIERNVEQLLIQHKQFLEALSMDDVFDGKELCKQCNTSADQ